MQDDQPGDAAQSLTHGPPCSELLQTVLKHAPVVLWEIDACGVFQLLKGAGLSLLGLGQDELVGQSVFERYKDHPQILYWVRRGLRGEERQVTVELDGIYFDAWMKPLQSADGQTTGLRGVATVITGQVQAEEALRRSQQAYRKSQQRFETLARMAPVGIYHCDADGKCLYVNEQWCSVSGLAPEQARGDGWRAALHPDDRTRVLAEWTRRVETGTRFRSEYRLVRPDGVTTWVLDQAEPEKNTAGQVTSFVGTVTGINDQKQIEQTQRNLNVELESRIRQRTEALRKSDLTLQEQIHERKRIFEELLIADARWRSVVEGAPDVILVVEPDGRISYANRPIPPFDKDEVVGKSLLEVIPADYHRRTRELMRSVLKTGQSVTDELIVAGPDGAQTWYSSRIGAVKRAGETVALTIVSRDITRQKRVEEESRRRQQELAHVSRLTTMGEMAAVLAHELNQPLAAIANFAAGCLRRLRSGRLDENELIEALGGIREQADRASERIQTIRRFVQARETSREPLNLSDLVTDAVELAQIEAQRQGVTVAVSSARRLPRIVGDGIQIEQVLLNLIINAIEAAAGTEQGPRTVQIETSLGPDGTVQTCVTDSGPGLPADYQNWIFEPFQSTKPDGLGMGLSISQTLVEANGGRLWAEPADSGGAAFFVSFPPWPGERR